MPSGTPLSAREAAARYDSADRAFSLRMNNSSQNDGTSSNIITSTRGYAESAGALTGLAVTTFHLVRRYVDMLRVLKAQQAAMFLRSFNKTHRVFNEVYSKIAALLGVILVPVAGAANWVYEMRFLYIPVSTWLTSLGCLLLALISIDAIDWYMDSTDFSDSVVGCYHKATGWIFGSIFEITNKFLLLMIDLMYMATGFSEKAVLFLGSRWLGKFLLTFLVVCLGFLVWNIVQPSVMRNIYAVLENASS